ncbi:MAG: hypothetical protein ACYCPS_02780 [Candidatus Saccharimonadales bacterium]
MRLEYEALAVLSINFLADVAVGLLAHPIAKLGIADFSTNHAAHDVAHLILGTFGF